MPKRHRPERSRSEQARRIAWEVSERIAAATSPGLGKWGSAWEQVSGPPDRFMDALYLWETDGTPDDLEAMQRHAEALITAWREADKKFQDSLRTESPEAVREPRKGLMPRQTQMQIKGI